MENLTVGNGAPFQIDNGFPHILPGIWSVHSRKARTATAA